LRGQTAGHHQGFFFGEVKPGVLCQFGKHHFDFVPGSTFLAHDQVAKPVNDINQALVLFVYVGKAGVEAVVPLKSLHDV
jgi:hypothetical protein